MNNVQPLRTVLTAVPFTDVKFTDRFWAPRIEVNRTVTLSQCFYQCEITNRIKNFEIAGGLAEGKFEGIFFNDSDVYKVVEGAAYTLSAYPDPKLDEYLDNLISKFASAQQKDGYLNTYFTLVEPDKRWTNLPVMHELYCAGHLFEAAVAHYRATGKRNLLDIAVRFADYIDSVFGEDRLVGVPGHEEIELALVKLYEVTGEKRYLNLAKFFIDKKGLSGNEYNQDNIPVREQSEIVGHAVRAMYLYAGVADVAKYTGDEALIATMDRIWHDVTERKMYVTGGIGPSAHNEGFTVPYDLPNETAYAETCAAIGMAFWNHRLLLLHGQSKYADLLEKVLYNGSISGVSLDGASFFYVNPLASHGKHHRQPWFGCACCPTNVVRFIPQMSGYVYATSQDGIWVNLYAGNQASITLNEKRVEITQETDYPWSGNVKIIVRPSSISNFDLNLRIPSWCNNAKVAVNGQALPVNSGNNGYLKISREWRQGDLVNLEMPMTIQRIIANPKVDADVGRVALQRGPVVYCLEGVDNNGSVMDIALPRHAKLEDSFESDLLGGVVTIKGKAVRRKEIDWNGMLYRHAPDDENICIKAIPYHAWDNREAGEMIVWIPETTLLTEFIYADLSASHINGSLRAVIDNIIPRSSDDLSIPRFTWWDHKGTYEWISLTFKKPRRVSQVEVYWFDDTGKGGCRVPESWEVQWFDGNEWRPVTGASKYEVEKDKFNRVTFEPIETTSIRLMVKLREGMSGGILKIRL
ncbi:MAG: glycoside hydrolase family 127 protein [bacterium]